MIPSPRPGSLFHRGRPAGLALLVLASALCGCGWRETTDFVRGRSRLELAHEAHSQEDSKVRLLDIQLTPGLDGDGGSSVFELTLQNTRDDKLYARLLIDSPRPAQGCEDVHLLDPMGRTRVHCPQKLETNGAFELELTVYDDIGHTHVVERARVSVSFGETGEAALAWK